MVGRQIVDQPLVLPLSLRDLPKLATLISTRHTDSLLILSLAQHADDLSIAILPVLALFSLLLFAIFPQSIVLLMALGISLL